MDIIHTDDPYWNNFFDRESKKEYFKNLMRILDEEYSHYIVFPDKNEIFNAFKFTKYKDIKVVIIGQDPYHTKNMAMGLSFSVKDKSKIPPSLKNIYKEIYNEYGYVKSDDGDLTEWVFQGVFLLNSILTVRGGCPLSHKNIGWEIFTDSVISLLNDKSKPVVFVLWGKYAQTKSELIDNKIHLVLKSPHPSPFSANKGFFGNNHFIKINNFLEENYHETIQW